MSNIMSFIELLNRVTDSNIFNDSNILNDSFLNQPVLNKPCSASFVDELEKVVITNEDVDNNLCCAICQSSFKLGEKVIKQIGRAHVRTPVTRGSRMPSSA